MNYYLLYYMLKYYPYISYLFTLYKILNYMNICSKLIIYVRKREKEKEIDNLYISIDKHLNEEIIDNSIFTSYYSNINIINDWFIP